LVHLGHSAGAVAAFVAAGNHGAFGLAIEASRRGSVDYQLVVKRLAIQVRGDLGVTLSEAIVVPRGHLPLTTSGKPRRSACAELAANGEWPKAYATS
jgi:acyl-CoA synthetase (AMP-forming)/AMP-acid ligase II